MVHGVDPCLNRRTVRQTKICQDTIVEAGISFQTVDICPVPDWNQRPGNRCNSAGNGILAETLVAFAGTERAVCGNQDSFLFHLRLLFLIWQPESAGLDVPLMRIADNTETYYIVNGNKNVIALKDSSGADVSTYNYTPFGTLENPADGDENPFRFSSEYHDDETGLVYYNYRYYSPQLGRWTKRDLEDRLSRKGDSEGSSCAPAPDEKEC